MDESTYFPGSAVQLGDELAARALDSGPYAAEESSTYCQASTSIVLGFGRRDTNPLARPPKVKVDDLHEDCEVYRRVDDSGILFATDESDSSIGVGLFKKNKGSPDLSTPVQNQSSDLNPFVFPVPVAETCGIENAISVYQKAVNHPHIEDSMFEVDQEDEVDYDTSYREGKAWEKVQWIGEGASGSCYVATDRTTNSVMVVKQMSVQFNDRVALKCEVDVMKSISHDNIVKFIGATESNRHFNIFMEYMAGGSLEGRLKNGGLCESTISNFIGQLLSGLAYLHNKGIVHRDLKSGNLLLDTNGTTLRVADFGAAARLSDRKMFHQMAGTPPFMAPEVVRASPTRECYSEKCDVWSMGCVMIEMATGNPPWVQNKKNYHRFEVLYKIGTTCTPPPMPKFHSRILRELLVQCLRVDQDERPSSQQLLLHNLINN